MLNTQVLSKIIACSAVIAVGMLTFEGQASAAALTFDNQGNHTGGLFSWDSTSAKLTNGVIDRVSNGTTSLVTGTCAGGFGCINFETGARISVSDNAAQELSIYADGGLLSITGMVPDAGAAGTLYTTNFGFVGTVLVSVNKTAGPNRLISISGLLGSGALDSALANYFQISNNTLNGTDAHTAIVLTFNDQGNSGTGLAQTNSVLVTADSAVPEPASMMLIGTGLVSLAFFGRRRMQKSS